MWGDSDPVASAAPGVTWGASDPVVGGPKRPERTSDWIGTRLTHAATGMLGIPRAMADVTQWGADALGMPVVGKILNTLNPVNSVGRFLPSSNDMNAFVKDKIGMPEVNTPGKAGKVLDAATEAAISAPAMGGNIVRSLIPAFVGGGAQEIAGQATEGTPYEIPARLLTGAAFGVGAAGAQNATGNVLQAVKNIAPNIDETAAKIIARALERDQTTGNALQAAHANLGPGAMAVEAAGPNVRGVMRGSVAAPGAARTAAQDAFDTRIGGSNVRTTNALDSGISPNGSLATTTEQIAEARARASRPAYEAAGVPGKIVPETTVTTGKPTTRASSVLDVDGNPIQITEPGKPIETTTFNSPLLKGEKINALLTDSADVKAAIAAARRLPEYKDVPANSMIMLDKAYKHIGGMADEAKAANSGERGRDLNHLRAQLGNAIAEENPAYGNALATFAGPSKVIDAGNRAREWFTKNIDPKVVKGEFAAMSPAEQEAAKVGIRDWARTAIGRSDRGVAAERVWNGGNNRERLEAILSPDGFASLAKTIGVEKNAIKTSRDINVGSRTAPMALEAADNANGVSMNALADVGRGNPGRAAMRVIGNALSRVTEGRTEAVNAQIAKLLTSTDPADVGLVASLAEKARVAELAKQAGRRNALSVGMRAPLLQAGSNR